MKLLPANLTKKGETPIFTEATLPEPLQNWHQTGAGTWAEILVSKGIVHYEILTDPPEMVKLTPGRKGVIEPEQPHRVQLTAGSEMQVVFYSSRVGIMMSAESNPQAKFEAVPSAEKNYYYRRIRYRWIIDLTVETDDGPRAFKACFNEAQFDNVESCLRYLQTEEPVMELESFGLYRDVGVMILPIHES